MDYKVKITSVAKRDIDAIVYYLVVQLENKQAAQKFLGSLEETKRVLKFSVKPFQLCTNKRLRAQG